MTHSHRRRLSIACLIVAAMLSPGFESPLAAAELQEVPPPPSAFDRVDAVFKAGVDGMNLVLFYRLGQSAREYIVYERKADFVRDRGSDQPFQRWPADATDEYPDATLTDDQVQLLAARGELAAGHTIMGKLQNYRHGQIEGRPVDYVTVKRDSDDGAASYGDKFIWDPEADGYRKVLPKRSQLEEKVLSPDEIAAWNKSGHLSVADAAAAAPYLHRESIGGIPVIVAWLALGAVFFTLYMRGFNVWGFRHAVDIVRGKYDNPDETGEVTHFQALASALSATVGLGNIGGVTIAMTLGGPGAFFWMLLCGIFGMCSKFTECTLGQKYRHVKPDGTVLGGPMRYLKAGLDEMKLGALGTVLSVLFAVMCILASFGGGNMYQANQAGAAMMQMFQKSDLDQLSSLSDEIAAAAQQSDADEMKSLETQRNDVREKLSGFEFRFKLAYGVILAALVGVVIIGGIKRIGAAASKIVPSMCLIYVAACLFIILKHLPAVPGLVMQIFNEAFTGEAMGGGIVGVLVVGVQRAAFSNEAGAGSAAIAHSAAKTEEPIREGCVALLGPFIDTVIVCSMTALVILITGAWDNNQWLVEQGLEGAALTSKAFDTQIEGFSVVLSIAVTLFAYSTIISWSYYGERAWESLFGAHSTGLYKVLAVICVFVGTIVNLGSVLDFSDMMILGMAFPNIAGVVLLAPKVKRDLDAYWKRYKSGEFRTFS